MDSKTENFEDVAAIITAMTDGEQPFLFDAVNAVLSDLDISQVVLCIEENNSWVHESIGDLILNPRLQIVRLPMMSAGAVRNRALTFVEKDWVAYCDGDDIWCPGKTSIQRTIARDTECDLVGADHYLTDEKMRVRAFAIARYIPMPSSWLVKADVMRQHPFIDASGTEDGDWWIRTREQVSKVRCPRPLVKYRVRVDSISSSAPSKRRKMLIVKAAKVPVVGVVVLLLTYFVWLLTRKKKYIWLPAWG